MYKNIVFLYILKEHAYIQNTAAILEKLAESSGLLAELKGVAATIPNQGILINTLGLQEAKDSSEIENIVTPHDELFKDDLLPESVDGSAAKEVLHYRQALRIGFAQVSESDLYLLCIPNSVK